MAQSSERLDGLASIVAGIAHELNTPIGNSLIVASTLKGDTERILREAAEGPLRKQRFNEYLGAMQSGTVLLERALQQAALLISNFKRIAVEQGSDGRRVFDLRTVIDETLAVLQPSLARTPFRVEVEVPEGVRMDSHPGALEQVLGNLVNNAITHAFAGRSEGLMRLIAGWAGDGERVRLMFTDDGAGMSAATLARIYEPFFTTALGQGGSGLGMHIVHQLVTGPLGGEIEVNSAPGEGCRVTLLLPLAGV